MDPPDGGQIGQLIDEYAQIVNPAGQALTWADLDACMWNYHPRTNGNPSNHSGQTQPQGELLLHALSGIRASGAAGPAPWRAPTTRDRCATCSSTRRTPSPVEAGTLGNGVQLGYGYEYLQAGGHGPGDSRQADG